MAARGLSECTLITIAGMNFEIKENEEVSVASGSIKLELGDKAKAWYKELWG
jgi:hypothetical protein